MKLQNFQQIRNWLEISPDARAEVRKISEATIQTADRFQIIQWLGELSKHPKVPERDRKQAGQYISKLGGGVDGDSAALSKSRRFVTGRASYLRAEVRQVADIKVPAAVSVQIADLKFFLFSLSFCL